MGTITAHLSEETTMKLNHLAQTTQRGTSFLVAEAVEHFLEEQAWQMTEIQDSLAQADAGTFASSTEVREAFAQWGLTVEA